MHDVFDVFFTHTEIHLVDAVALLFYKVNDYIYRRFPERFSEFHHILAKHPLILFAFDIGNMNILPASKVALICL